MERGSTSQRERVPFAAPPSSYMRHTSSQAELQGSQSAQQQLHTASYSSLPKASGVFVLKNSQMAAPPNVQSNVIQPAQQPSYSGYPAPSSASGPAPLFLSRSDLHSSQRALHAPVGTHAITPVANNPSSFASLLDFEVAQSMPQPPLRASTAAAATAGPPHRSNGINIKVVGSRTVSFENAASKDVANKDSTAAGKSTPFVFRTTGRAGKVSDWLNSQNVGSTVNSDEQKENSTQQSLQSVGSHGALQRYSSHELFSSASNLNIALALPPSNHRQQQTTAPPSTHGNQPNAQPSSVGTNPAPQSSTPNLVRPNSVSGPNTSTVPNSSASTPHAHYSSINNGNLTHQQQQNQQSQPEGIFIIRNVTEPPPASAAAALPPIPSAKPSSQHSSNNGHPPPVPPASGDAASARRNNRIRVTQSNGSSGGAPNNTADRRPSGNKGMMARRDSVPNNVPAPVVSLRTRPVNRFIVRPEPTPGSKDEVDSKEEPPSSTDKDKKPDESSSNEADKLKLLDAEVAATASLSPQFRRGPSFSALQVASPTPPPLQTALEDESILAARVKAREEAAAKAEADRLAHAKAQAEAEAARAAQKEAERVRCEEADASFTKEWFDKEEKALPVLLEFLASAGGRSLLAQKPAHGFLLFPITTAATYSTTVAGATTSSATPSAASVPLTEEEKEKEREKKEREGIKEAFFAAVKQRLITSNFMQVSGSSTSSPVLPVTKRTSLTMGNAATSSGASSLPVASSQVFFDFLAILIACEGCAQIALWILEKWRLKSMPATGMPGSKSSTTGVVGSSGARTGAKHAWKFGNLSEMIVAMTQARRMMIKEQKEWFAIVSAETEMTKRGSHSFATSSSSTNLANTTLSSVLFPTPKVRDRLAFHPHMDALWIRGGGHAAGVALKFLRGAESTPGAALASGLEIAPYPTVPAKREFECYPDFLAAIAAQLSEAKQVLRESILKLNPVFIEGELWEVLTVAEKNGIPPNEYVYSENVERVVGLKSSILSPAMKPISVQTQNKEPSNSAGHSQTPQQPTSPLHLPGSANSAFLLSETNPAAVDNAASEGASAEEAAVNENAAATGDGAASAEAPVEVAIDQAGAPSVESVAASVDSTATGGEATVDTTADKSDPTASPRATTPPPSESPGTPGKTSSPLSNALSPITYYKSLTQPSGMATPPAPMPVVLLPTPDVTGWTNLDALTAVLHLAQGLTPALSYLRSICMTYHTHAAPNLTKLSVLLSSIQLKTREFKACLTQLCDWFELYGPEFLRQTAASSTEADGGNRSGSTGANSVANIAAILAANSAAAKDQAAGNSLAGPASSVNPNRRTGEFSLSGNGRNSPSFLAFPTPAPAGPPAAFYTEPVSQLYWASGTGVRTLPYIAQLFESKKKFSSLVDLSRRLRKIFMLNAEDYVIQRGIVRKYLQSDAAILFQTPSNAHSPLTFSLNFEEHLDMLLNRCMIPQQSPQTILEKDISSTTGVSGSNIVVIGTAAANAHQRSSSSGNVSGDAGTPNSTISSSILPNSSPSLGPKNNSNTAGGNSVLGNNPTSSPSSTSLIGDSFFPPNWNRSWLSHASGYSIVRHLEYIVRQRRQQTIQEWRYKIESESRELGGTSAGIVVGETDDGGSILFGADREKVIQPLLFHDIHSLIDYVLTLAVKAKQTIEETYVFIASASSSLLIANDDSTYSGRYFQNPANLRDFSQATQWSIQDAKLLFETSLAGHDCGEYAQRVSDAKLVHLHRCLDAMQQMKLDGKLDSNSLPLHPLAVPCNGEPLEGLMGCSFHFPNLDAFIATLDRLYSYDISLEINRHKLLEDQFKSSSASMAANKNKSQIASLLDHMAVSGANSGSNSLNTNLPAPISIPPPDPNQYNKSLNTVASAQPPQTKQEILLAWLQRSETTLLNPALAVQNNTIPVNKRNSSNEYGSFDGNVGSTAAPANNTSSSGDVKSSPTPITTRELEKNLTLADMDRLMIESGGGDGTLEVLQTLQQEGKSYASLDVLIGAVAYTLNPELQPKEGVKISMQQLMNLLKYLSANDRTTGSTIFRSMPQPSSVLAASIDSPKEKDRETKATLEALRSRDESLNPLELDGQALTTAGDPIAPQLYGVPLSDVLILVGYAFGVDNLISIIDELMQKARENAMLISQQQANSSNVPLSPTSIQRLTSLATTQHALAQEKSGKFLSFADLKAKVIQHIKRLNPFRSWMGLPALIVREEELSTSGEGGPNSATPTSPVHSSSSAAGSSAVAFQFEQKAVKDIYDFVFNTNHNSIGTMLASSSSNSKAACKLLPSMQLKIPMNKTDAALLLRYDYCQQMLRICETNNNTSAESKPAADAAASTTITAPTSTPAAAADGTSTTSETLPPPGPAPPAPLTSKNTLFILHHLNDASARYKTLTNLTDLVAEVSKAKQSIDERLVQSVEAIGAGAREVYSFLQSNGAGASPLGDPTGTSLPGMKEKALKSATSGVVKEKLELSVDLLASLVAAGGGTAKKDELDVLMSNGQSSAVNNTAPPPALTILSHLSLLGEEYSKGQGEQLVQAVRAQKIQAESVRKALAENIKQVQLETAQAAAASSATPSSSGATTVRSNLTRVIPPKIRLARDSLLEKMEDAAPRFAEVEPFIHGSLPKALIQLQDQLQFFLYDPSNPSGPEPPSFAAQSGKEKEKDPILVKLRKKIHLYQIAKEERSGGNSSSSHSVPSYSLQQTLRELHETFSLVLRKLGEIFEKIPTLAKDFNVFFGNLQPLHQCIHAVYSQYYPLFFYLQQFIIPTPQPFFQELLPALTESISFLTQLRSDTKTILDVQQSLTYVLEKLSPILSEMHAIQEEFLKYERVLPGAASSGVSGSSSELEALCNSIQSRDHYLLSLLPFLSSMFQTNEHYLPFLMDLVPFFESQLRPLLPAILPLLIPVASAEDEDDSAPSGNTSSSLAVNVSASGPMNNVSASPSNSNLSQFNFTTQPSSSKRATANASTFRFDPQIKEQSSQNQRPVATRGKSLGVTSGSMSQNRSRGPSSPGSPPSRASNISSRNASSANLQVPATNVLSNANSGKEPSE